MSKWLNGLLLEWRHEQGDAGTPFRALRLISEHVKRAGVTLRLTEVVSEKCATPEAGEAPRSDPPSRSSPPLSRVRWHVRDGARHAEGHTAPKAKLPIDEVRELRTEVAHLKESLAELLVANLRLRKRLDCETQLKLMAGISPLGGTPIDAK